MRKLILAMRTSLDGFATGPDDDLSWMPATTDEQWEGLFELLSHVDLLLLGGGMWEGYHWYWSQVLSGSGFDENDVRYARYAERTEHVIFSSRIKAVDWTSARIETGDAVQAITELKQQPGKDIQLVGGAEFAASMIDAGLVDEYRIEISPVILGKGKSIFQGLRDRQTLLLTDTTPLDNGVVIVTYSQVDTESE